MYGLLCGFGLQLCLDVEIVVKFSADVATMEAKPFRRGWQGDCTLSIVFRVFSNGRADTSIFWACPHGHGIGIDRPVCKKGYFTVTGYSVFATLSCCVALGAPYCFLLSVC